jgi:hypothetical protein
MPSEPVRRARVGNLPGRLALGIPRATRGAGKFPSATVGDAAPRAAAEIAKNYTRIQQVNRPASPATRPILEIFHMNEDLIWRVRQALAPSTTDGTESHAILEGLATEVRDAAGNPVRIRSALLDAKVRARARLKDLVPVDAVIDALLDRLK